MCGRYTTVSTVARVEERFRVQVPVEQVWEPNANVSAGAAAPVIADENPGAVQLMQFGFTPRWAKKQFYTLNARSEGDSNPDDDPRYAGAMGILRKPMFRQSIRDRRCIVIADAFIEGPKDLKLSRPFLVFPRDGQPLALAGIWDEWAHPETGECIRSFAVLTTVANPTLQAIGHHRSPVVLDPDDERVWIDREAPIAEVTALMRPCPTGRLNAHPIDPAIRDPRANGSELLRPTGELVHPEHRYILHEHLQMFGMGEGRARNRAQSRGSDQLPLFG